MLETVPLDGGYYDPPGFCGWMLLGFLSDPHVTAELNRMAVDAVAPEAITAGRYFCENLIVELNCPCRTVSPDPVACLELMGLDAGIVIVFRTPQPRARRRRSRRSRVVCGRSSDPGGDGDGPPKASSKFLIAQSRPPPPAANDAACPNFETDQRRAFEARGGVPMTKLPANKRCRARKGVVLPFRKSPIGLPCSAAQAKKTRTMVRGRIDLPAIREDEQPIRPPCTTFTLCHGDSIDIDGNVLIAASYGVMIAYHDTKIVDCIRTFGTLEEAEKLAERIAEERGCRFVPDNGLIEEIRREYEDWSPAGDRS